MEAGYNLKDQVTYLKLLPRFMERQQSFKDIGFVYLVNHGLSEERVNDMFKWVGNALKHPPAESKADALSQSKRFFDQPMAVKMLAPHPASGSHHRGKSASMQILLISLSLMVLCRYRLLGTRC